MTGRYIIKLIHIIGIPMFSQLVKCNLWNLFLETMEVDYEAKHHRI